MSSAAANWPAAFSQLYEWLEDDRDRHKAVILADYEDLYRVELWIDRGLIVAASGNELPEVVVAVMKEIALK